MIAWAIISELRNIQHNLRLEQEKDPKNEELVTEIEALEESIQIVKSRVPQPIIKDFAVYLCPNCRARIKPGHTYCKKCAQAIKKA